MVEYSLALASRLRFYVELNSKNAKQATLFSFRVATVHGFWELFLTSVCVNYQY